MTATTPARPHRRPRSRRQRALLLGGQVVAFGAALWFLARTAQGSWGTITLADLRPAWAPLVLASILTGATYLFLVWAWVWSLSWWGQSLRFLTAARIWFVTNLARFIPGMIWQLAGVAAMAHTEAISPAAATGGILLQQIVLVATGLVLAAAITPNLLGPWAASLAPGVILGGALLGVGVLVALIPRLLPWSSGLVSRVLRRPFSWGAPPRRALVGYVLALTVPWLAYGLTFWLFSVSLLGGRAPGLLLAGGAFVASYVAGLIVVFAPSGILVREAALVAALTPTVGGGAALVLAFGSRLWLLVVELLTAAVVVVVHRVVVGDAER